MSRFLRQNLTKQKKNVTILELLLTVTRDSLEGISSQTLIISLQVCLGITDAVLDGNFGGHKLNLILNFCFFCSILADLSAPTSCLLKDAVTPFKHAPNGGAVYYNLTDQLLEIPLFSLSIARQR